MAEGLSNAAIADRMSITPRTVEAHATRLFLKLDIPGDPTSHRRVRAVLAFLRTTRP